MVDVLGGDGDGISVINQQGCLGGDDHVGIQRLVVGGRFSHLPRLCPEFSGTKHDKSVDREQAKGIDDDIESRNTALFVRAQQFAPHFVVGDFRNQHLCSTIQTVQNPLIASIG